MKRSSPILFVVVVALLISSSCTFASDPWQCERGLTAKSATIEKGGVRIDWCVDSSGRKQGLWHATDVASNTLQAETVYVDGLRHGASRTFDHFGNVMTITEYENGIEKHFFVTDYYLGLLLDEESQKFAAAGKSLRIRLGAGRRIVVEKYTDLGSSSSKLATLGMLPSDLQARICKLVLENNIMGIDFMFYGSSGAEIKRGEIQPSECSLPKPIGDG